MHLCPLDAAPFCASVVGRRDAVQHRVDAFRIDMLTAWLIDPNVPRAL